MKVRKPFFYYYAFCRSEQKFWEIFFAPPAKISAGAHAYHEALRLSSEKEPQLIES